MSNKSPNLIKVAAIQMSCIPHDKEANVENALRHIEATAKSGAKLLVLPEIFTMGYHCLTERNTKYFDEAEPIPGPTTRAIGAKAKEYGVYVVTPIFERAGPGNYYNTAALIGPEQDAHHFRPPCAHQPAESQYLAFAQFKTDVVDRALAVEVIYLEKNVVGYLDVALWEQVN